VDAQEYLTALHQEHGDDLLRFLRGFTRGDQDAAGDLLQETMIRAWRRRDSMPGPGEPARRWLFTVARNVALDTIRMKRARPVEVGTVDLSEFSAREDTMESAVALTALRQALRSLSTAHRFILTEIYLKGRTVPETARRLGVPDGTVKSRVHYAMRSLRQALVPAA
jgi:RNA polymerase sigma-70 factor (ECF subfamily)